MSSTPGSSKLPLSPICRTSTPTPKPPRPFHSSSYSRSRTHLPHPKVLPFPDIPVRAASREVSPVPTRQDPQRSSADGSTMYTGGSSDGVSSSGEGRGFGSSSSPLIHSPLARASTPQMPLRGSSRSSGVEIGMIARTSTTPLLAPARTEGFHSTPASPSCYAILLPPANAAGPSRSPAPLPTPAPSISEGTPGLTIKRDPALEATPSLSAAITSPSPPNLVVDHIHLSFLKGTCADVRLWVRKWGVAWHVHRMILVQAGRSLSRCAYILLTCDRLLPFAFPRRVLRDSLFAGEYEG